MVDIIRLYEALSQVLGHDRDDEFYDAPEGEVQIEIVREMLDTIRTHI